MVGNHYSEQSGALLTAGKRGNSDRGARIRRMQAFITWSDAHPKSNMGEEVLRISTDCNETRETIEHCTMRDYAVHINYTEESFDIPPAYDIPSSYRR